MTPDELQTLWKSVLGELEVSVSNANFKMWFRQSVLLKVDRTTVTIGVSSNFILDWIRDHFENSLLVIFNKHLKNQIKRLSYSVVPLTHINKTKKAVDPNQASLLDNHPPKAPAVHHQPTSDSNLNRRYTFDSFVVGSTNRLAHAAATAIAEKDSQEYNPLYIYGGVGLGKTHLAQAVGNEIVKRDPKKKVIYVSCENFMNEFVSSISSGKKDEFKNRYRNADLIIMDDIQFIAGKAGTQEEFFHTFNALHQKDKQIILTSDKVPKEIIGLEARLSSRFSAGMVTDIKPPDEEMRQAILQFKCREKNYDISDEIITYIAANMETNTRELEGALNAVHMRFNTEQVEPTLDEVAEALKDLINKNKNRHGLSTDRINEIICNFYNVTREEILGPRRNKEYVRPRQILMYLLKNELRLSYPIIGRYLGGRDHTTIMHGNEKIEKEVKRNPELFSEIKDLKEQLYKI